LTHRTYVQCSLSHIFFNQFDRSKSYNYQTHYNVLDFHLSLVSMPVIMFMSTIKTDYLDKDFQVICKINDPTKNLY